jgi:hypothetical protein
MAAATVSALHDKICLKRVRKVVYYQQSLRLSK